jgi:putative heme-binding domain-containing protein
MNRRFKVTFAAICALWCVCPSKAALGQALPDGKGKTEFLHSCTTCHRADTVTSARKTPEDWKKSVADMAARGATGSPEELDNITLYLFTHYALEPSGQAAAPAPPAAPLTAAELETVNGLIADNGCVACHRIEAQGAYLGPSLNGLGARRTPDQVRAAIIHPNPTLGAGNKLVKLTTADGKTMVVRLLSQDDRTIRIVDPSGAIVSYAKPDLHDFAIVDANPMPSYQKRIAPEDLDSLVRYLRALPPVGETMQK